MAQVIHVLLFARYAELLGTERADVPARPGMTVADVVRALRARPGGAGLPARPLCAVNLVQAEPGQTLAPGDEVALLPPLAGG